MYKKVLLIASAIIFSAFIPELSFSYEMAKNEKTRHSNVDTITADLNRDGSADKVTLIKKEPPRDFFDYDIVKDASLRIEEGGKVFSAPLGETICYKSSGLENVVIADNVNPFIAVSSCVPSAEDDWSVTLYSFDGNALTEQLRVTSNEPSIQVKDADDNGVKDIVVIDRDYENDPKVDKYITTYKYIDGKWKRASVYRTKTKKFVKSSS